METSGARHDWLRPETPKFVDTVMERMITAGLDSLDDLRIKAIQDYRDDKTSRTDIRSILTAISNREIDLLTHPPRI